MVKVNERLRHSGSTPDTNGMGLLVLALDQKGKRLIKKTPKIFEQCLSINK